MPILQPGSGATVLVVDDNELMREVLGRCCRDAGYEAILAATGREALAQAVQAHVDLVLLDLHLPDMSGLEVCRALRTRDPGVPVLIVSGCSDVVDIVVGLEVGADDYLTKPFDVRELQARIRARLRRGRPECGPDDEVIELPGLRIDVRHAAVDIDGHRVALTHSEFVLLSTLASRAGEALTREMLYDTVCRGAAGGPRAVDTLVYRVRRRIEPSGPPWRFIESVYGIGFRMALPGRRLVAV